jgi:hypothetical protein
MKKTREIRRRVQIATVICFALIAAICVAQNSPGSQTGLQTGGQLPSSSGGASPLGTAGGLDNTPSPFLWERLLELTWERPIRGQAKKCVAVMEGGEPKVIANEEGGRTTPSSLRLPRAASGWWAGGEAAGDHQSGEHGLFDQALYGPPLNEVATR